jgi:signal transduction histidine kinase/ligand-binding sensor domain-containing protein/DNA-binding response OmpR family regulator
LLLGEINLDGCLKILLLYFLFSVLSYAQSGEMQFEHFSLEEGLSATTVLSILQDSRGFLWIGTYDGLNRYDGYSFTTFKHDPSDSSSLSSNNIWTLFEDSSGVLWIGTWSNGLNKFDKEQEKFIRYSAIPDDPKCLSSNEVTSICQGLNNQLWIGTKGGLNRFDIENEQFINFTQDSSDPTSISSNSIFSLCVLNPGTILIGTADGLNSFDVEKEQFIQYKHDPSAPTTISNNIVLSIIKDKYSFIWIGTFGGGLNKFDPKTKRFTHYKNDPENPATISDNEIYSIFEDSRGELWIGTFEKGLNRFDRENERFIHYIHDLDDPFSLSDDFVFSVYEDNSGVMWFGTWDGGLNKYYIAEEKFLHYSHIADDPKSLNCDGVRSFCEDNYGNIWVGTNGGGLNQLDRERNQFTHYIHNPNDPSSLSNNLVYSICEDNTGNLWIGTGGGGLNKFDIETKQFIHYKHNPDNPASIIDKHVSLVYEDKMGTMWIGTSKSDLIKFDMEEEKFIIYSHNPELSSSLSQGKIFSIFEDKSGALWIGLFGGGLCKFNRDEGRCKHYINSAGDTKSLSNNVVSSIYEDNSGILWVGTEGGLNKFDRENEEFFCYREADGLPGDMINGILEDDDGNLWLSTNNGITKFNPVDKTFTNYDVIDGLQGKEFNQWSYYKTKSGEMLFGGNNGFNMFHPDSIDNIKNPHIPQIIITEFQLLHKPVSVGFNKSINRTILNKSITETKEIELLYDENVISFEFAALDFHIPEKNKYAYFMEGFDKDWTYTDADRRFVNYTNLNPGEYTFRVKGSNNDGVWNEEGISLKIIIAHPWWATWWAYIFYGVFVVVLFSTSTRFYLNRQRLRHQLELEHEHAEKLEEVDRMKSRFFANISHEFRTPLTLILGPCESIIKETSKEEIKKRAGTIKKNANRLLSLINQLMDLSKLDAGRLKLEASYGNIVTFVKGVAMLFESLAERKDIILKFKSTNDEIDLYFDKEKMEKILTNLFSNAFKFTPVGGKITVVISENETNSVIIKIKDTGIGISENEIPRLFDRFYQVDSSQTREQQGTGIGLSLTKELIELHNGTISVESREKEWTEVTVTLPLGKKHLLPEEIVEVGDSPLERKILVEDEDSIASLEFKKPFSEDLDKDKTIILVVEDNTDVREYIKETLVENYQVEEAANGEQGLRKAENIIPDLIISDIMMPRMDGNELTRKLKNDEKTSHIPIILLTAKTEQESKLEGLARGADDYLMKPFDTQELQIRIKNIIENRRKLQKKFREGEFVSPRGEEKKLSSIDERFMNKIMEVIEQHITEEEFSIEEFGNEVGMSRSQIHRKLKALSGKSASRYIRSVRLARAKKMIDDQKGNISEIAYSIGFSSPAYFTKCFKDEYGFPPSDLVS